MVIISLDDQIIPLDKIINKSIKNVTLKETISLIFHAAVIMSNSANNLDDDLAMLKQGSEPLSEDLAKWKELYQEFENELERQNKVEWPQISIIRNDYDKRIDILSHTVRFITSTNIFTYLLRLLYIENYKRPYIYKSYNYHKILGHKLKNNNENSVITLSIDELFLMLKDFLMHYTKIYNDDMHYESIIVNAIFKQLI